MLTREMLIQRFHDYGTPRERWLVGGEFERLALRADGRPVGYRDERGIRWILGELAARFGWAPIHEGEHLIALTRGVANITLEPGGQVELSGAPWATLAEVAAEARRNLAELGALSAGADLSWTALGLTPYADIDSVPWVPKGRYVVMREYLPGQGDLAHQMMKGTTSFQANFDYSDEADCALKLGTMSRLGPLTTAMFANSPLRGGRETGFMSFRGHIWTRTDPARTGFPLAEGYTHAGWVDYLLDVPMMFIKSGDGWAHARGRTFHEYMTEGIDGARADWGAWDLHQTSVFPEVRVKRTIEIRGADAVALPLALGGVALWTGLLYDRGALEAADALSREFVAGGDAAGRFEVACREGLAGQVSGRSLAEWAADLVAIAKGGLAGREEEDRALLAPLEAQVASGESPGAAALRAWREDPSPAAFLPQVSY